MVNTVLKYPGISTGLLCLLLFATLILASACSNEPDAVFVDFSNRITVEQPMEQLRQSTRFRVAVGAVVSAKETAVNYHPLLNYFADNLNRDVELVQRRTYREINELIGQGHIDLAFISSGPYILGKEKYGFEALAIPEIRGSSMCRSYLIVNKMSPYQKLEDLNGKVFAFTDEESNTGKLIPAYWLKQQEKIPEDFFGKIIYTHSHDNSIMAVAMFLADGAAVHGHIWEYYNRKRSPIITKTRIIKRSEPFGNSPIVVSSHLSPQTKIRIRKILLKMHQDKKGQKILAELMIDRFIEPPQNFYDPILAMKKKLDE